jgi:biotin-dependent carboxylase-like uncharacterized protein
VSRELKNELDAFYVLDPGMGLSLQDGGRHGWRRYGVPVGGMMDSHAGAWANQLLGNAPDAPVLEVMQQGAKLAALRPLWIAVCGADLGANVAMWRAVHLQADEVLSFERSRSGVWTYVAVEGGFSDDPVLGSVSVSPRVSLGTIPQRGTILRRWEGVSFMLPQGVAGRVVPYSEQRNYLKPPPIRLMPGPQWDSFPAALRHSFMNQAWTLSSRSDRTGYRLEGQPLKWHVPSMISEPVRVGTVQLPEGGLPIITLRDGPTVGGYPKIGYVHPDDLSWVVQSRAGQTIQFRS